MFRAGRRSWSPGRRPRINRDLIGKDRATGLLNKIGLQKKAQDLIRQAARDGCPLAFGVVDIDKFKTINDTWGHYFGDIVIKRGDVRHFSFSGGLAAFPACRSENELFLRADAMLYEAKQAGRNRICSEPAVHA